jgi:hypothetical protein
MTGKIDQTSLITGGIATFGSKAATGMESETASASSSPNVASQAMVKKEVPKLFEYWKAPTTTEKDLAAYHAIDWLPSVVLSSSLTWNFQ